MSQLSLALNKLRNAPESKGHSKSISSINISCRRKIRIPIITKEFLVQLGERGKRKERSRTVNLFPPPFQKKGSWCGEGVSGMAPPVEGGLGFRLNKGKEGIKGVTIGTDIECMERQEEEIREGKGETKDMTKGGNNYTKYISVSINKNPCLIRHPYLPKTPLLYRAKTMSSDMGKAGNILIPTNIKDPNIKREGHPLKLPPRLNNQKYTIILDLDGTLIYKPTTKECLDRKHLRGNNIKFTDTLIPFIIRPGVSKFIYILLDMGCELILYTAGGMSYARNILVKLGIGDWRKIFTRVFTRENCHVIKGGGIVKDLRLIKGREVAHMLVVDDNLGVWPFQVDRVIGVKAFRGELNDAHLLQVIPQIKLKFGITQ